MGWQVSSALQTVTWITLSPPTVLYLFSLIFAMSVLSCICICKLSLERLCPQLQLHAFVVVIAIVNRYCCWALRAEKIIQSDRVTKITCIFYSLLYFLRAKGLQSGRGTRVTSAKRKVWGMWEACCVFIFQSSPTVCAHIRQPNCKIITTFKVVPPKRCGWTNSTQKGKREWQQDTITTGAI